MPSNFVELIVFILFPPIILVSRVFSLLFVISNISVISLVSFSISISPVIFPLLPTRLYSFILLLFIVRATFDLFLSIRILLRTISIQLIALSPLNFCLSSSTISLPIPIPLMIWAFILRFAQGLFWLKLLIFFI